MIECPIRKKFFSWSTFPFLKIQFPILNKTRIDKSRPGNTRSPLSGWATASWWRPTGSFWQSPWQSSSMLVRASQVSSFASGWFICWDFVTLPLFLLKFCASIQVRYFRSANVMDYFLFLGPNSYVVIGCIGLAETFSYGALGVLNKVLTLMERGGVDCACTFCRWQLLHKKGVGGAKLRDFS